MGFELLTLLVAGDVVPLKKESKNTFCKLHVKPNRSDGQGHELGCICIDQLHQTDHLRTEHTQLVATAMEKKSDK